MVIVVVSTGSTIGTLDGTFAIFVSVSLLNGTTREMKGHFLHTVTNPEYGNLTVLDEIPNVVVDVRCIGIIHGRRTATQNNRNDIGRVLLQLLQRY